MVKTALALHSQKQFQILNHCDQLGEQLEKAHGIFNNSDCPVCQGDCEIDKKIEERIDVEQINPLSARFARGRGTVIVVIVPVVVVTQKLQSDSPIKLILASMKNSIAQFAVREATAQVSKII